jgi:hypothetical protein
MDHWRMAYLGIRQVPRELSEFELNTFFTFSRRELASIDSRRSDLYRLAMALHVGFIRMTGRALDSYKQIPTVLLRHLGQQLGVQSPDVGTLRSIYDGNLKTLSDHQIFAQTIINFRSIAEHQRRYVIRWLKEQLTGRPERSQLMSDLKRWFYEHRIVIPPDRMLRQLVVQAVHDVEASLHETLQQALGTDKLDQLGSHSRAAAWRPYKSAALVVGRSASRLDPSNERSARQDQSAHNARRR